MDDLRRAQLATEVLENEAFVEAMDQIEKEIYTSWKSEGDALRREWLWSMYKCHNRLKQVLVQHMQTGQMKVSQIERKRTLAEQFGKTFRGG